MIAPVAAKYNVGGVLLAQPFKVRRLGHFGLYIKDMAKARTFTTIFWGSG